MTFVMWSLFAFVMYNAYPSFEDQKMRFGSWPNVFIYPLLWVVGLSEVTKYFRNYNLQKAPSFKDNYTIFFFSVWFVFLAVVPFFSVFVLVLVLNDT